LDSGLTLADWLQYAVEQLKKGEVDKVLQDGAQYHKRYGPIPTLTAVLERAVEDKLANVTIDDAGSAAKAIPMLEPLARDLPGSLANVKLNRARAMLELEVARVALKGGRFDEAEQRYRAVLQQLPTGDPLRLALVPEVQAANKRERLEVTDAYFVQSGAFTNEEDARAQVTKLSHNGFDGKISMREQSGKNIYRVRIGPLDSKDAAEPVQARIEKLGFEGNLVRQRR
jgi:hypothetical protein